MAELCHSYFESRTVGIRSVLRFRTKERVSRACLATQATAPDVPLVRHCVEMLQRRTGAAGLLLRATFLGDDWAGLLDRDPQSDAAIESKQMISHLRVSDEFAASDAARIGL